MELDGLVATVRGQSDLASEQEARASLLAVLEVVGAHVGRGGAEELAAGLPQEAARALRAGAGVSPQPGGGASPQAGTGPQLYAQVARRLGLEDDQGANRVQGALRALAGAVDQERLDRVRSQLPTDVGRMLQREDEGDTSQVRTGA